MIYLPRSFIALHSTRSVLCVFGLVRYFSIGSASVRGNLPTTPMYIILGNQLWQGWDYPTELPAVFEIDWVKAWVPT
eukprot:m.18848 g.18848  ORF g.18848 m.18848 type:complete len:77 (+) comp9768_c0_seq1:2232-2462(+)